MGRVDWLLEALRSCDDRCRRDASLFSHNCLRLIDERELSGGSRDDAKRRSHHS